MANWQVVIEGRQGTDDMLNVIYYQSTGVEPPDFVAAAVVIRAHIEDHIQTFCGDNTTWLGITYREDIPGSVGVFVPFPAGTLAGSNPTPSQVYQLSMLVQKFSNGSVRPVRGWAFQGGLVADGTSGNGGWETPLRDAVEALWEDIRVLSIAGPTTLQMVLKATNPTAPNTQPYTAVDKVSTAVTPRTLDGRRLNVGS